MRFIPILLVLISLSGCNLLPLATPTPESPAIATPESSPISVTATAVPNTKNLQKLSIWVPAEFDPNGKSPAANLLLKTIQDFESKNSGVTVDIRVKAGNGPSGLMETLALTSEAAPEAMPSIVLLTRSQLEETNLKGILFPYEGLSATLEETDWYPFAREMATIKDGIYGLPVSGDVLVLVLRSNRSAAQAPTWEDIQKMGSSVLFAAADPQATVTLALYRSAGGTTQDSQSVPKIQTSELEKTLALLAAGAEKNIFPTWLINYQSDKQVLDIFSNQQNGWVITWLSNYLPNKLDETSVYAIPSLGTGSATFASGTVWALTDTNPERRQLSVKLAEYLTRSEFLSQWNLINNSLPPRPSALTAWPDTPLRAQLNLIALAAEIRPANDVLTNLGPAIQEATILILKKQSDPARAADTVIQRLAAPASK
ncbi:MAG TPA: extracellular solute-binding protein [Leptolinea sp.]